jgi:biopolymer transport protein ExbD
MTKEYSKALSYITPLVVILGLIGAFFLGSRNPYIPKPAEDTSSDYTSYEFPGHPQIDVWISKDQLFSWNGEPLEPLEKLPTRIRKFKENHQLRFASVSGDDQTRFEQTVTVLSELKKAGFRFVTIETRVKPEPGTYRER